MFAIAIGQPVVTFNSVVFLVTRTGTLLMETGLLHDYFGKFSAQVKDIIFVWRGVCKVRLNPHHVRLKWTLETEGVVEIEMNIRKLRNSEEWKVVLDLHMSDNELSLDLHKSSNELSLDLHKSGNKLSLDLHKSSNEFI